MLSTVAQCEFAVEKSSLVYAMNQEEQTKYDDLSRDIGTLAIFFLSICFGATVFDS